MTLQQPDFASQSTLSPKTRAGAPVVVVLGGGPSAFYAADHLMKAGYAVVMVNQDEAAGGGTRYEIRYDKGYYKTGILNSKFLPSLKNPRLAGYYGGVKVGREGTLTLEELSALKPAAIVLGSGSRGKVDPGIPGKELPDVFDANELALYYNEAPGYENFPAKIGRHVVILGMGNVVADMIVWLADREKTPQAKQEVETVTILGRRGSFESKLKSPEMQEIAPYLDLEDLKKEILRVLNLFYQNRSLPYFAEQIFDEDKGKLIPNAHRLTGNPDQDVETVLNKMLLTPKVLAERLPAQSGPKVRFRFLTQPESLESSKGRLSKVMLLENELIYDAQKQQVKARSIGRNPAALGADTFIYSIGTAIDPDLGLPMRGNALEADASSPYRVKTQDGLVPIFMYGWARQPSKGLVGQSKKDVDTGIRDCLEFLAAAADKGAGAGDFIAGLESLLRLRRARWVRKEAVAALHEKEVTEKKILPRAEMLSFFAQFDRDKDLALETSV